MMQLMAMMSKLTASYIAGFLDGEGCFSIWYKSNPKNKNGNSYYGRHGRVFEGVIRVGSTDKETLLWLKDSFGGSFSLMSKPDIGLHHKQAYQWALHKKDVIRVFLKHIMPYLRTKKEHANVLYEFINTFKKENYEISEKSKYGGVRMKDHVFKKRLELWEKMSSLNQKGTKAAV